MNRFSATCNDPTARAPVAGHGPGQSPWVPDCRWSCHDFTDPDDQAGRLTGWSQEYEQLSAGRFEGSVTELWINGAQLICESSNQVVHQAGRPWPGSRTFIIPVRQQGAARFGRQAMSPDTAVTMGPGEALDFLTASSEETVAITLSVRALSALSQVTEQEDLEIHYSRGGRLVTHGNGIEELRLAFRTIFGTLRHQPEVFEQAAVRKTLHDTLMMKIFETLAPHAENDRRRRVQAHRRIVDKAKAYVIEHRYEAVTIPDLCKAIGVSRRNLQLCFNEQMGCSPIQFLRAVRLNRVRRELRESSQRDVRVQTIAGRWGFWHMSSFSANYKSMFGELPSETLMRCH